MATSYSIFVTRATDALGLKTDGVSVSSTNTYYSRVFGGANSDGQSIHLEWSGTPTGTFTLWTSDKMHPSETDDTDWVEDTSFSPSNPAGSADNMADSAANMKANLKRIKYVNASGSGTLKGWVTVTRG